MCSILHGVGHFTRTQQRATAQLAPPGEHNRTVLPPDAERRRRVKRFICAQRRASQIPRHVSIMHCT